MIISPKFLLYYLFVYEFIDEIHQKLRIEDLREHVCEDEIEAVCEVVEKWRQIGRWNS